MFRLSPPRLAHRATALLLATLLPTLSTLPVHAGESALPVSRPGVLHLDLESAIRMALAKNFEIKVEQFSPQVAQENVTKARGVFDPVLELGASRAYTSRHGDILGGERVGTNLFNRTDIPLDAGLSGQTALGTQYRFGWNSTLVASGGHPRVASGPEISLTQPLLNGAGPNATLYGIRIARSNVQVSEWQLRARVTDIVTELIYVYNELHFSIRALEVAKGTRELARQLLKDNTQRAEIGVMSPLDITTARAEVAAREEGVILAQRAVLDNENLLKQLVTDDLQPMLGIRVEIEPPPSSRREVRVPEGIKNGLEFRPEFRQARLDLEQRNITIAYRKNQALPKLDLVGSLGLLGLDTGYGSSAGRILRGDSLAYSGGAVFSIPLGNRAARSEVNIAKLEAARALVELQRLEQAIVVDVDNAAGQVISDRARILSTSEATRLARESLDAGEQRLRAGTGTTFEVLELQRKLAEAESAELRANSDHNKAVAEFARKTGTTLQEHHVDLK